MIKNDKMMNKNYPSLYDHYPSINMLTRRGAYGKSGRQQQHPNQQK